MRRLHALFEKYTEKEIMTQMLQEVPEDEWDEWLPEYYGQYLFLRKTKKREIDYVFVELEEFSTDGMDSFRVLAFSVDREVFCVEEKALGMKEIAKIMNLYVPDCVRKAYGDLQIVCGIIRAMSEDFCMFSRAKENEELFAEVKSQVMNLTKSNFIKQKNDADYKRLAGVIIDECKALANTPFYTLTWQSLTFGRGFPKEECKRINLQNPPDISRCQAFHAKVISRIRLAKVDWLMNEASPIVISDEGLSAEDIPYVYLEGDELGDLSECANVGLDFFSRRIKVKLHRKMTKSELLALLYLYILYPVRMKRQCKKNFF